MEITRFQRFLALGTEGTLCRTGEFTYAPEDAIHTAAAIRDLGPDAVTMILGEGRKSAQAYALAMAASLGDAPTRRDALAAMPSFLSTSAELFAFCDACRGLRGWGRGLRTAVGRWYTVRSVDELSREIVTCPEMAGWSHRDLLRLAHPAAPSPEHEQLFQWITTGEGHAPSVEEKVKPTEPERLEPTERSTLIAIDASTSMHGAHAAVATELANALAGLTQATLIGFSDRSFPLSAPVTELPSNGGWVDHSVPFAQEGIFDAIIMITDADTWNARSSPEHLLKKSCRLVVVGLGPRALFGEIESPDILHVIGYDGSVPALVRAFIA
ncbi:MAG: TROVE domain-containing protein [Methanoregulaceae archaeon]|nr:TROVE domain-containing protein [Methanoregulaceae archaeon]